MHQFALLRDLVILVAVAIPVVVLTHRLKVASVVGFLLTGVLIGPHGLSLIGQPESVASLAEIGVVLLLFTIGLGLSLARIIRLGRVVLLGGGLQVLATLVVVGAGALALAVPLCPAARVGALAALAPAGMPLVGIGGIDATNAAAVIGAGAAGVAVISAIFAAGDVAAATRRIRDVVDAALNKVKHAR